MDIVLTEKAKRKLLSYEMGQERFLRIAVVAGGCSGNTYSATLDSQRHETDEVVYEEDGLQIVADGRSALFLDGLNVDYSDDLIKAGFRLSNPNASSSCGCGASFKI